MLRFAILLVAVLALHFLECDGSLSKISTKTRRRMTRWKWMFLLISASIVVLLFYTYSTNEVEVITPLVISNTWAPVNIQRDPNAVLNETDILVVGGGFSGAVLAYLHASILNHTVLVIEKRDHIGGNCYDYIHKSGIRVSKYGHHSFYTNDKKTWDFISQFTKWLPYKSRLMGFIDNKYVPLPPNINTVDSVTGLNISTVDEMKQWIDKNWINAEDFLKGKTLQDKHKGMDIYKKVIEPFSRNYFPFIEEDDEKSNAERWSIRHNFDTRFYSKAIYQGIPHEGYSAVIHRLLGHPNIVVHLNTEFSKSFWVNKNIKMGYYTGKIDEYFKNVGLPKLEYESIKFETIEIPNTHFFQPSPVVYYFSGPDINFKITEYKHFSNLRGKDHTLIVKEKLTPEGVPLLPLRNSRNSKLYKKYKNMAKAEEKTWNIRFVGGLTTHEYLDMATTITKAIETFENLFSRTIKPDPPIEKERRRHSLSIIVNHCTKSLQWLANDFGRRCADRAMNIFIYEKCGRLEDGAKFIKSYPACNARQIVLPNIGREGHTWIYHLLTQSVYFQDINVFLQGGKEAATAKLYDYIRRFDGSKFIKEENSVDTPLISLVDTYASIRTGCANLYLNFSPKSPQEVCDWYSKLTHSKKKCNNFISSYRGEMIVSKTRLRRTLSKHSKFLLDMYHVLSKSNNPNEGHVLERLWEVIFRWPHLQYC